MSQSQKDNFDVFFKSFVMLLLMVIGFFATRAMNSLDKATDDIQFLKIQTSVLSNDVANFKEAWKAFIMIENQKQKERDQEKLEDAIKK